MTKKSPIAPNTPRDHEFDGIVEYDNDLPRWWVALFILTIIFSVGYLAWYHLPFFPGESLGEEYATAAKADADVLAEAKAKAAASGFDYAAAAKNPEVIQQGKTTFDTFCVACHGAAAQGVVGPNLTDDMWLHGDTLKALEDTITKGVPEKGMPSWEAQLGPTKISQVVAFIRTIQHTNPAGAKPPQGDAGILP